MKNNELVFCLKISAQEWIKSLRDGTVCFNPVEYFIKKAEKYGNNEQGDRYEGVFACLKKDNPKIDELKKRFGLDLEIIDNGEFLVFRRKSSRNILIFCMYGIQASELNIDRKSIYQDGGDYFAKARYVIPAKMYEGFLDSTEENAPYGFYCSVGHFHDALDQALNQEGVLFRKVHIEYDIDLSSEFYIEPDDNYVELNHKRRDLSYQHEVRYLLPKLLSTDKKLITYDSLSDRSCGMAPGALYMEMILKVEPIVVAKENEDVTINSR